MKKALLLVIFAACTAVDSSESTPSSLSAGANAFPQICTPNDETCDFSCVAQGGPSSSDCIVKCNSTGTAWVTIADCGWAQNGHTSSSCLDRDPHPVCENN